MYGSSNPSESLFEGDPEFHLPGLLLAYIIVTGRTSGYLFSEARDGSARPSNMYVTNAVKRIARLGGIQLSSTGPRFSAHSLRRTAIHRALRCDISALDVRDMTAHKDSLVLATYTINARAEGAQAKRESDVEIDKDPWAIYWMFKPVERVVPGASGTITSAQVAKLRPNENKERQERLLPSQARIDARVASSQAQLETASDGIVGSSDASGSTHLAGVISNAADAIGTGATL